MLYKVNTDCILCSYQNPKATATAVIIKDQSVLVLLRNTEPFKGMWDFPGGYMNKDETPEETVKREVKEELGVDCTTTFIKTFEGYAYYKDYVFPVISHTFLVDIKGDIRLDTDENSEYRWIPLSEINDVAYDSNQKTLSFIKEKFMYNLDNVKDLISQLDSSAVFNEQAFYKALLEGHISTVVENGKLLGMGWLFPRQTLLRRQAVVEDMIVDEEHRGKGYGEKILRDLIAWGKEVGMDTIELTTNPKREAANSLYKKVGFWLHETNHYLLKL